jgi:hypothetical protein
MLANKSGDSQNIIVQQHHEQHKSESLTNGGGGGGRLLQTTSGPRTPGPGTQQQGTSSHHRPEVILFQSHIKAHSLDCSFISDTILALGGIEDAQLPVYQELLDYNEVLVWNLSGVAMSSSALEAFNQQGLLYITNPPIQFNFLSFFFILIMNICYSRYKNASHPIP